ncbi:MAG: hypothetical protein V1759_00065 [bacterium]
MQKRNKNGTFGKKIDPTGLRWHMEGVATPKRTKPKWEKVVEVRYGEWEIGKSKIIYKGFIEHLSTGDYDWTPEEAKEFCKGLRRAITAHKKYFKEPPL